MRVIVDLNPTSTTATVVQQQIPAWYQSQLENVFGRATGVANLPYQTYGGPRVAGFSPDQQAAFSTVRGGIGAWRPFTDQAANTSVTGAANPYYERAAQGFPSNFQSYMSPYTSAVTDEIGRLGTERLTEDILPALDDRFIGSGQFGSGRHADIATRAATRNAREVLGAQSQALERGYSTAGQLYGQDVNAMLGAGQGVAQATNQDISNARALAELVPSLNTRDAAALQGIGQEQQALQQRSLDTAYGDFLEQRNYPRDQASFLSSIIRGFNPPTSSSSTSTAPATAGQLQPSTLGQIGGLGLGALGLLGGFGGFGRRGGRVPGGLAKKYADGGGVRGYADGGRTTETWVKLPDWLAAIMPSDSAGKREPHGYSRDENDAPVWRGRIPAARSRGWGLEPDAGYRPQTRQNAGERDTWDMARGGRVPGARVRQPAPLTKSEVRQYGGVAGAMAHRQGR